MRLTRILIIMGLSLFLQGCSYAAIYEILNNSGMSLKVETIKWEGDGEKKVYKKFSKKRWIEHIGFGEEGRLVLLKENCLLSYDIPNLGEGETYPFPPEYTTELTVRLQLEPDMSLHFVPDTIRRAVSVSEFADIQPVGFPKKAISTDCSGA